jgi:hypothetical protein
MLQKFFHVFQYFLNIFEKVHLNDNKLKDYECPEKLALVKLVQKV